MDTQLLAQALISTLDPDPSARHAAESHLADFCQSPYFTISCLELAKDPHQPSAIQQAAAVYLKNQLQVQWTTVLDSSVKSQFKQQLLYSLHQVSSEVTTHLVTIVYDLICKDFASQQWQDLIPMILSMLNEPIHQLSAVLCTSQLLKYYSLIPHVQLQDHISTLNSFMESVFPLLYQITQTDSDIYFHILWKTLKCFKYAITNSFPKYFSQLDQLQTWLPLFTGILMRQTQQASNTSEFEKQHQNVVISQNIEADIPIYLEANSYSLYTWLKCKKWACQIQTMLMAYAHNQYSSITHKHPNGNPTSFPEVYVNYFGPKVCAIYIREINELDNADNSCSLLHSTKSLVNVFRYIEYSLKYLTLWTEVLAQNVDVLISSLIFKTLLLKDQELEAFHSEPEEYLSTNIENIEFTPRSNAKSLLKELVHYHGDQVYELLFQRINSVIAEYQTDTADMSTCVKKDAVLQVINTIRPALMNSDSLYGVQLKSFIFTQVSLDTTSPHGFLRARACEVISQLHEQDIPIDVVETLYSRIMQCLHDSEVVVQFQAAMALRPLMEYDIVKETLANQISQVMACIFRIFNSIDSERLSVVIEELIDSFPTQLAPFAMNLATQLTDQFLRLYEEITNRSVDSGYTDDKNMAAYGLLNTFGTLIISLGVGGHKEIRNLLLQIFSPIMQSANEMFYEEVFELVDLSARSTDTPEEQSEYLGHIVNYLKSGYKVSPSDGPEYYIPTLCTIFESDEANSLFNENNLEFYFQIVLDNINGDYKTRVRDFAELVIISYCMTSSSRSDSVNYGISQLLSLPLEGNLGLIGSELYYSPEEVSNYYGEKGQLLTLVQSYLQADLKTIKNYEQKAIATGLLTILHFRFTQLDKIMSVILDTIARYIVVLENLPIPLLSSQEGAENMTTPRIQPVVQFEMMTAQFFTENPAGGYEDEEEPSFVEPHLNAITSTCSIAQSFMETVATLKEKDSAQFHALCAESSDFKKVTEYFKLY